MTRFADLEQAEQDTRAAIAAHGHGLERTVAAEREADTSAAFVAQHGDAGEAVLNERAAAWLAGYETQVSGGTQLELDYGWEAEPG